MPARYLEAVALGFPAGEGLPPALTAKGELWVAERIVEVARRYGIPVVERPELCQALGDLPLDHQLPRELFEAAAAVLVEAGALGEGDGAPVAGAKAG